MDNKLHVFTKGYGQYILCRGTQYFSSVKINGVRVIKFIGQTEDPTSFLNGYTHQSFLKGLWFQFFKLLKQWDLEHPNLAPKKPERVKKEPKVKKVSQKSQEVQGSLFDL